MRKRWTTGAAFLAAVLLISMISGCGQKPEHTQATTTQAEEETSEEGVPEDLETSGTGENGVVMIGGADGPTAIFVASKYDLTDMDEAVKYYISNENEGRLEEYSLQIVSFNTLAEEETEKGTVRYLYYGQFGYQLSPDGQLYEEEAGGHFGLVKMTLDKDANGEYQLVDYWTPRDGGLLDDDVRENFPEEIREEAITAHTIYGKDISEDCLEQARKLAAEFAAIHRPDYSYSEGDAAKEDGGDPLLEPTTVASEEETDALQPTTMAADEEPEVIPVK